MGEGGRHPEGVSIGSGRLRYGMMDFENGDDGFALRLQARGVAVVFHHVWQVCGVIGDVLVN